LEKLGSLEEDESIFSNPDSLEPDFIPPFLPFRENEMKEIASTLKPLCASGSGRNIFITGKAGIGKTHAVKKVLRDLGEETKNILIFYINCWTHSTSREVFEEILSQMRLPRSNEMTPTGMIEKILLRTGERPVVLCFDEIDKAREHGFLYSALEEFKKKVLILISNNEDFLAGLDERIRSRLLAREIIFRPYSREEMAGIIRERRKYAFYEDTWSKAAIEAVEEKAFEAGDVRFALHALRLAGLKAESKASRTVMREHAEEALAELEK